MYLFGKFWVFNSFSLSKGRFVNKSWQGSPVGLYGELEVL